MVTMMNFRPQITLFAHESATIASSIEYLRPPKSETANDWLKEFKAQRLCSKTALEAGVLHIRFVIDEELIVSFSQFYRQSYCLQT
jgi:hypothetical protein